MPIGRLEYDERRVRGFGKGPGAQAAIWRAGVPHVTPVIKDEPREEALPPAVAPAPTPVPAVQTVQEMATAGPGKVTRYQFLGIDITNLAVAWNNLMDKLGLKSGKMPLGRTYKTNQWDSTISELERE